MAGHPTGAVPCLLCQQPAVAPFRTSPDHLSATLQQFLRDQHPELSVQDGFICRRCLNTLRSDRVVQMLQQERGTLTALEAQIARSVSSHLAIAEEAEIAFDEESTPGQRLSDQLARNAGSWSFVIWFLVLTMLWMTYNSAMPQPWAFDPFPFILLNLLFSTIAAIQAPIIMMSQNRTEERDRQRSQYDLRTNIKAEVEIAALHAKVDHLLAEQWERMVEIQMVQMEILTELADRPLSGKREPKSPAAG